MAFGSNNKKDENMTTRGLTFANKDGHTPSRLTLGFWNKIATINLNPALPENERTQEKVYDYDSFISIMLSSTKASTLLRAINKRIRPILEGEVAFASAEDKEVGVDTNKGYIGVGTGATIGGEIAPYIVIKELDNDLNATSELYYSFKSNVAIVNFDGQGGYTPEEDMLSEFDVFTTFLSEYIKASTLAKVHAYKEDRKYYNKRQMTHIESIMTNLGVTIPGNKGYSSNYGNKSKFSSKPAPAAGQPASFEAGETEASMAEVTGGMIN